MPLLTGPATLLVHHRASVALGNDPRDWRALTAMYDIVGYPALIPAR
jgi:hypothetical protein